MNFITSKHLFLLLSLGLITGCTTFDPFNRQSGSPPVALPVETVVEQTELPPLTTIETIEIAAQKPATESLVAKLARPWTLSDKDNKLSCTIVLTNAEVTGTNWKRVNAGGSCFNKLNFVTGWTYAEEVITLYNAKNEIMATLNYIRDNQFSGLTATGLPIKISY